MGTTNQPYGNFLHPHLPFSGLGAGLRLPGATIVPTGGRVHYVRSTGKQDGDDETLFKRIHTTLNAALAQCRSGAGDIVFVLPGHSESISSADAMSSLVAGTKIIGIGNGTERPTFTWTAATATFLLDVANVTIENCRLLMDPGTGTVNVAAPITVSAAGCSLVNCYIRVGTDANSKCTIPITTTAAGDDFTISGCEILGATAAECTTVIQLVGADRFKLLNTRIVAATSSASVGVVRFLTTASTDVLFNGVVLRNNKSGGGAGDMAVTGMAGVSGEADNMLLVVLGNNVASLTAAWGTPASMVFGRQCYVANTIAERAALFGTESA